jgi:NAD(P)-dependent dehydrogenase (short-subunit alcohol dehydrogenase family)
LRKVGLKTPAGRIFGASKGEKMDVEGKAVLVTGGASGLGEATVRKLASRGAKVIVADINPRGDALQEELKPNVLFCPTDVTREADGERAVDLAVQTFGGLHGLVTCAGIAPTERIVGRNGLHSLETFARTVSINLVGTFNMMRLAANAMAKNEPLVDGERGVIVTTASVAAFEGQIGQAAYAASKAGVVGMTLPAARELARSGIRVVSIAPGLFETPMMAGFSSDVQESLARSVPFPARLGRPAEYAAFVLTIFENSMLNGETIRLDGAIRLAAK